MIEFDVTVELDGWGERCRKSRGEQNGRKILPQLLDLHRRHGRRCIAMLAGRAGFMLMLNGLRLGPVVVLGLSGVVVVTVRFGRDGIGVGRVRRPGGLAVRAARADHAAREDRHGGHDGENLLRDKHHVRQHDRAAAPAVNAVSSLSETADAKRLNDHAAAKGSIE